MSVPSYIDRPNRPLYVYALIYLAFLYVPVLFLPLFSFNDGIYVAFPIEGLTTKWYEQMLSDGPMGDALLNSLNVGGITAVLATLLGIFGAKAVTRYRIPGKQPMVFVIMLPLVIPGILLGVALLILMKQVGVELSLVTVTIGHVLICVPFAMATLIPRFEGFDKAMEEASADLGANAFWTFWRVTLPMVLPGIVASLLLCFTRSTSSSSPSCWPAAKRRCRSTSSASCASPRACPLCWRSARSSSWFHSSSCSSRNGCGAMAWTKSQLPECDHDRH